MAFAVAVDGNGGFVIGGVTSGIVHGFTVTGGKLLLAKYDANGAVAWQKTPGAAGYTVARSVAVDPNGNVYAVGEFMGTLDFGGGKTITSNGSGNDIDVFLVKLNAGGAPQWIKRYGNNGKTQVGYGVAADAGGNVYITGTYEGGIDFGGGGSCHPPDANAFDVFVAKINGSGACSSLSNCPIGLIKTYGNLPRPPSSRNEITVFTPPPITRCPRMFHPRESIFPSPPRE